MANGNNWFVENIPIIGPIVGAAGVIITGFIYQDKKISGRRTIADCNDFREDLKGQITISENNIKRHLDLKLKLVISEIKREIKNNGGS